MQNLMGRIRRCAEDYNMICAGDKIAVGVSGGKDSLSLLYLLAALRRYYPVPYELQAVTIDMGLPGMDFSPVAELCAKLDVPYQIKKTEIGPIIFEYRHEKNPCSMCAKMRRGALNDVLLELGCNKIALGHHFDDAVETFLMSLLYEGRISCFEPVRISAAPASRRSGPCSTSANRPSRILQKNTSCPSSTTSVPPTSTPSGRRSRS